MYSQFYSVVSLLLEHVDVVLTVHIQFLDWNKATLKLWQNLCHPAILFLWNHRWNLLRMLVFGSYGSIQIMSLSWIPSVLDKHEQFVQCGLSQAANTSSPGRNPIQRYSCILRHFLTNDLGSIHPTAVFCKGFFSRLSWWAVSLKNCFFDNTH